MSSLIVEVSEISTIEEHGNADALEIAVVKGWRCIVQKGKFKPGDKVVYFPVDTVLPVELSDRLGVTKYLSKGRLRAAKLRGIISCGLVIDCEDDSWEIGQNVVDHYGVTKWEPPEVHGAGDAERDHAMFLRYTDIENIRNFPDILQEGEEVVITEKIHGTNGRCGMIGVDVDGKKIPTLMAGSHNQRRKEPEDYSKSLYWLPLDDPDLMGMIAYYCAATLDTIIVYSEIFGDGVQDLKYGMERGEKQYRVFDMVGGDRYVDYDRLVEYCTKYEVPMVPVLYRGPWKQELLELAGGRSVIAPDQLREGIVIKPVNERWDDRVGRVILKCISDEYLVRKKGTEKH